MIFAASVVYFDEKNACNVLETIKKFDNVEIYEQDLQKGKMVIVTEAEDNNGIENVEKILRENDSVVDVVHCAFHFGENVDDVLETGQIANFDFESAFKKKRKQL